MPLDRCNALHWFLPTVFVAIVVLTGCVRPVKPLGSAIPAEIGYVMAADVCNTVRMKEIEDHSRSLPYLELDSAAYYIRLGGQSHRPIDIVPNELVKVRADGKIDWRLPVSHFYESQQSLVLSNALYFGHDNDTGLLFIQTTSGVSIIRANDGAFLANIARSGTLQASFDLERCRSHNGVYIGLLTPVGYSDHRQEWHFLSNELLNAARR